MRPVAIAARTGSGVAVLALLLLVLPLLGAALALGPGGLPHEAAFHAHASHDVSAAALDHIDRWLHGDLCVALAPSLRLEAALPPLGGRCVAASEARTAPTTARGAESERRF